MIIIKITATRTTKRKFQTNYENTTTKIKHIFTFQRKKKLKISEQEISVNSKPRIKHSLESVMYCTLGTNV